MKINTFDSINNSFQSKHGFITLVLYTLMKNTTKKKERKPFFIV